MTITHTVSGWISEPTVSGLGLTDKLPTLRGGYAYHEMLLESGAGTFGEVGFPQLLDCVGCIYDFESDYETFGSEDVIVSSKVRNNGSKAGDCELTATHTCVTKRPCSANVIMEVTVTAPAGTIIVIELGRVFVGYFPNNSTMEIPIHWSGNCGDDYTFGIILKMYDSTGASIATSFVNAKLACFKCWPNGRIVGAPTNFIPANSPALVI